MINKPYTLVISGGPMPMAAKVLSSYVKNASKVICADSGVDYAMEALINISEVYGDLDSISDKGREYIKSNNIPLKVFPVEKDMTDTELVLSSIEGDVVLFVSLKGRIDHVMANILIGSRMVNEGRNIMVTDGDYKVFYLKGEDELIYETDPLITEVVTLLPLDINEEVKGVNTEGLYYELKDASLKYGYSLGVSNRFKSGGTSCKISQKSGIMGVLIGKEE